MNQTHARSVERSVTPIPDVILPSQFYQHAGKAGLSCEQRLMLAVLADAINILQNWRRATSGRKRHLYAEAERWVFGGREERVFSFDYVCDALALDPEATRRRLASLRNEAGAPARGRIIPTRLRLKESSRNQHLTVNRVRLRRHRSSRTARRRR